jgi:putative two-component system response regulator
LEPFNENKAVGRLSEILALEYGAGPVYARQIGIAANLHDVGKQKIPAEILLKPGPLTAREFAVMKTHTTIGAEMLSTIKGGLGTMARACCKYHHEQYDGGGYFGLYADKLPFYCQFVAIADVFTALLCERPYKKPWPPKDATDYIQSKAHTQFAPELVCVFLNLVRNDSRVSAIFAGA